MNTKIICRFANEENLSYFAQINNIDIDVNTKSYNVNTQEKIQKRKGNKRPIKEEWRLEWKDMPEYISEKQEPYAKIEFIFNENDLKLANEFFHQNITEKTKSVWYPKLQQGDYIHYRVVGGSSDLKYPVYVVSKGRYDKCTTSKFLSLMQVKHYVVVEPNEIELYKEIENDYCSILELDMSYKNNYDTFDDLGDTKSKGPGGARNFAWEHSIKNGFKWHWVMDDNANEGFFYMNKNMKLKARTGAIFKACEDFVERYDNIGIAGLNYSKFCKMQDKTPAYVLNTRIYSFLLIRNDLPFRWRGRYNEDTDLSLRVLKSGLCTVQFNAFLAGKATTQKISGGNTEEFYSKEGTYPKSKMLEDMHPDVAKVVWKFSRWHHQVDYTGFTQSLHIICEVKDKINDYGMYTIWNENYINEDKTYLEQHYNKVNY